MTISGGIKFFKKNYIDKDYENGVVTLSSGVSATYLRDRRTYTRWESSGSDDTTTEEIVLDFGQSRDVDRLIIVDHNFKEFDAKYWDGAAYQHFSNVITKEGSPGTIDETDNEKTTNYYEFDSVSTSKIRIQITKTQTTDAEKYAHQVIATEEYGTFEGYPQFQVGFAREQISKQSPRGKVKHSILDESFSISLSFEFYPVEADHTIIQDIYDGLQEFLIYPCGGDESQFRYQNKKGNRLKDIYLVWFADGNFNPNYAESVYILPLNYQIELTEVA